MSQPSTTRSGVAWSITGTPRTSALLRRLHKRLSKPRPNGLQDFYIVPEYRQEKALEEIVFDLEHHPSHTYNYHA